MRIREVVITPDRHGLTGSSSPEKDRLRENYLRCGITERDDTAYMRTVDPAFEKRHPPRW